jgi:site-specific DNA-methyltransferase (cytosine-N4-specific)
LKEVSRTKNDGAFWRYKRDDALKTLREALPPQVKMMVADVAGDGKFSAPYQIARADARRIPLKNASVSAVITSPPYLNRHDYTRVYALELLFSFLKSNEELKKLRYKMLRSNVEAKSVVKFPDYHPTENLRKLLAELKECDLPNRKVVEMVEGYFEDMFGVLKELKRVCQPGSQIAFVVGNCKYGSVMFPVDELLAEIGDYVGLRPLKITIARYRGNAPQQMKKFGREASRESIVIWENKK